MAGDNGSSRAGLWRGRSEKEGREANMVRGRRYCKNESTITEEVNTWCREIYGTEAVAPWLIRGTK